MMMVLTMQAMVTAMIVNVAVVLALVPHMSFQLKLFQTARQGKSGHCDLKKWTPGPRVTKYCRLYSVRLSWSSGFKIKGQPPHCTVQPQGSVQIRGCTSANRTLQARLRMFPLGSGLSHMLVTASNCKYVAGPHKDPWASSPPAAVALCALPSSRHLPEARMQGCVRVDGTSSVCWCGTLR